LAELADFFFDVHLLEERISPLADRRVIRRGGCLRLGARERDDCQRNDWQRKGEKQNISARFFTVRAPSIRFQDSLLMSSNGEARC
jgi:hypothetical protein